MNYLINSFLIWVLTKKEIKYLIIYIQMLIIISRIIIMMNQKILLVNSKNIINVIPILYILDLNLKP